MEGQFPSPPKPTNTDSAPLGGITLLCLVLVEWVLHLQEKGQSSSEGGGEEGEEEREEGRGSSR